MNVIFYITLYSIFIYMKLTITFMSFHSFGFRIPHRVLEKEIVYGEALCFLDFVCLEAGHVAAVTARFKLASPNLLECRSQKWLGWSAHLKNRIPLSPIYFYWFHRIRRVHVEALFHHQVSWLLASTKT